MESKEGTPNLTPILDMVFQLITFFMLVINFKAGQMDLTLKLPVVGSARPVDSKGQVDLLVLNIKVVDYKGKPEAALMIYGNRRDDIENYIKNEAHSSLMLARSKGRSELEEGQELPTTVVVRADKATPFKLLNRVIKACQENGFRRFALKALNKDNG